LLAFISFTVTLTTGEKKKPTKSGIICSNTVNEPNAKKKDSGIVSLSETVATRHTLQKLYKTLAA